MNRHIFLALLLAAPTATVGHVRELIAKDQWKEALAEARVVAAESPGPDAGAALGEALYRAGQIDDAGELLAPIAANDDAPARELAQLGLVRAAQGKDGEAIALLERAVAKAPQDPWVVYRASAAARTRARAVELLETYLQIATGDDPDRLLGARGHRADKALGERNVCPGGEPRASRGAARRWWEAALLRRGDDCERKKIRLLDTGSTVFSCGARGQRRPHPLAERPSRRRRGTHIVIARRLRRSPSAAFNSPTRSSRRRNPSSTPRDASTECWGSTSFRDTA
jgi:tetratricopeptide (TPR) repeat protein